VGYIENRLLDSFRRFGFGLWVVETRTGGVPVGICGLLKRNTLDDVDLGFAFLPEARGQGYAVESARFVLDLAAATYGLTRVVAITVPDNEPSARVLERLGMTHERTLDNDAGPPLRLFAIDVASPAFPAV
jgi:RimJ/RimL family protein N-acetyltransferase